MKKVFHMKNSSLLSLIILVLLLIALPFLYIASQQMQQLLTRAAGTKANLVVDASFELEPIKPIWKSLSQGGEEPKDMIAPVIPEIKALNPAYIRVDHIFDHHPTVSRDGSGNLVFNFASLDKVIQSIRATGATPFISLSYMPQAISSGDIIATPRNWNDWALVVQKTIERYSGKNGLNISDIYYEVWNEPDLFGKWKYSGEKNYLTLYTHAALGASRAQNTNAFKFGGPATTQLYKNWIVALAEHVTKNNLRLDFFSWHRYNLDPTQYLKDVADVTSWLFPYPSLVRVPRIISEWGFDSDINPGYDGNFGAAHTVATVRQAINGYEQLFAFEPVDGPDPAGKKFWGRWGLLTHPSQGKVRKPRYFAFQMLNELVGNRLLVQGEGTWVTALASRDSEQKVKILITNYDALGRNTEQTPLQVKSLADGTYTLTTTRLGQSPAVGEVVVSGGIWETTVILTANMVTLLELTPPRNPFLGTEN